MNSIIVYLVLCGVGVVLSFLSKDPTDKIITTIWIVGFLILANIERVLLAIENKK